MGKGEIVSEIGDGAYSVRLKFNQGRAEATLQAFNTKIATYTDIIAGLEDGPIKDQWVYRLAQLQLSKEYLETHMGEEITWDMWCADLTTGLTGMVGTIEIPGDLIEINIQPGYGGNAVYDGERDGQVQYAIAGTPAGVFYNLAMKAGWQKFMPTYRYGVITSINKSAHTCGVSLEPAYSVIKGIDINLNDDLSDVPIMYMECDSLAFDVDDEVVVQFVGQDPEDPVVIGFKEEPRGCCARYLVLTTNGYSTVYDIRNDNVPEIHDPQAPYAEIELPCLSGDAAFVRWRNSRTAYAVSSLYKLHQWMYEEDFDNYATKENHFNSAASGEWWDIPCDFPSALAAYVSPLENVVVTRPYSHYNESIYSARGEWPASFPCGNCAGGLLCYAGVWKREYHYEEDGTLPARTAHIVKCLNPGAPPDTYMVLRARLHYYRLRDIQWGNYDCSDYDHTKFCVAYEQKSYAGEPSAKNIHEQDLKVYSPFGLMAELSRGFNIQESSVVLEKTCDPGGGECVPDRPDNDIEFNGWKDYRIYAQGVYGQNMVVQVHTFMATVADFTGIQPHYVMPFLPEPFYPDTVDYTDWTYNYDPKEIHVHAAITCGDVSGLNPKNQERNRVFESVLEAFISEALPGQTLYPAGSAPLTIMAYS